MFVDHFFILGGRQVDYLMFSLQLYSDPHHAIVTRCIFAIDKNPRTSIKNRWKATTLSFPSLTGRDSEWSCAPSYDHLKLYGGRRGHRILVPSLHYSDTFDVVEISPFEGKWDCKAREVSPPPASAKQSGIHVPKGVRPVSYTHLTLPTKA